MGCQATKCQKCGNIFPACQLRGGYCASCRSLTNYIEEYYANS